MNAPTFIYQPTISPDDMLIICVSLVNRAERMRELAARATNRETYSYYFREARKARHILHQLRNAPTVDLDDMERHATRRPR